MIMYYHTIIGLFALYLCKGISSIDNDRGQEVQLAQIKAIVCALITKGVPTDVLDKTTIQRLQKYEIDLEKMSKDEIKSMCNNINPIKLKGEEGSESETQQPETSQDKMDLKHNVDKNAYETNTRGENDEEIFKNPDLTETAPLVDNPPKAERIISSSLFIALNNAIFPQQNETSSHSEDTNEARKLVDSFMRRISKNSENQIRRMENHKNSNELTNLILKLIDSKSNSASKLAIKSSDYQDNMLYNHPQTVSEQLPKINVIIIKENDYINRAPSITTESVLTDTKHTETPVNCKGSNHCNFYDATAMEKVIQETFQKLLKEAAKNMSENARNSVSIPNGEKYYENQYSNQFINPTTYRHVNNEMNTRKSQMKINKLKFDNSNSAEIPNKYWGRQGSVSEINDKLDFSVSKNSYTDNPKIEKIHYDPNDFPLKTHVESRHLYSRLDAKKEKSVNPGMNMDTEDSIKQQDNPDTEKHSLDNKQKTLLSFQDLDKEIAEMKREYLARNSGTETMRGEPGEDYSYRRNLSNEEEKIENMRDDAEKVYALDVVLEKHKHMHNMEDILKTNKQNHLRRNQKKTIENINKKNNIELNVTGLNLLREIKMMILNEIKKDINESRATGVVISRTGTDLLDTPPETTKPTSKSITAITGNTSSIIGSMKQDILNTIKLYLSNASNLLVNADKSSAMTNTRNTLMKQYQNEYETNTDGSVTHQMPCMKTSNSDTSDSDMLLNRIQDGNRKYSVQTNLYNEPNQQLERSLNQNKGIPIENILETFPAAPLQYPIDNEMVHSNIIQNLPENMNARQDSNNFNYNTKSIDEKNNKYLWSHLNPEVYKMNQLRGVETERPLNIDHHTGMSIEEFIKTQEKLNVMLEKFLATQNGLKKDDSIEIL